LRAKLTRRRFLEAAGAGAAWVALANTLGCDSSEERPRERAASGSGAPPAQQPGLVRAFRSRPDLGPPAVEVATQAHDTAPGYVFVAPKNDPGQDGPMIVDNRGELVWFRPMRGEGVRAMDFKVQSYRGEPVLTYYQGVGTTYGRGEYVILDGSYREVTRVRAGNGYMGDHHEFLITERDTALITIYNPVPWDLSPVGGSEDGVALDGIAQEVDIETGEVLFEWHSLDHVGLEESFDTKPDNPAGPFDYFHINSIDVDYDDNLLISARKTFTVYKVDRETGELIWRLGGKYSDFEMAPGSQSRYQHDARRQADGTITLFDNGGVFKDKRSYGVVLDVNEMSVAVERKYAHPDERVAAVMGSMQVLPNGNVFVGWGSDPFFSEFSGGELLFHASFPPEVDSYRAFRFPWSGQPDDEPAVAAERGPEDELMVYASWNGATEVATWQVLAGPTPERLSPVESVPRAGFETAIRVRTAEPYVGVRARDRSGRILGTSGAIKPGST
jgi:Arylsulfotransferase (ASST)